MDLIGRSGGGDERIRVRAKGAGYEVAIGGRTYEVESATVRPGVLSLRLSGVQYEVVVRAQGESGYWVSTAQGAGPVTIATPLSALAAQGGGKGGRRRQKVTAYMPGRVVSLAVAEGDAVTTGQGILVLEAMKMQNEIRAEHDGTVTRILVQAGQSVNAGDPLFELE
ncbi:MAG TPA: biotin/lipoyl-containing protein [Thermoanaerobaculia bacterium]